MYLKSMAAIVQNMQFDFDGLGVSSESSKLLRLGQQCLERMTDIISHLSQYQSRPKRSSSLSLPSPPDTLSNPPSEHQLNDSLPVLPDVPSFDPSPSNRKTSQSKFDGDDAKPGSSSTSSSFPVLPDVPGPQIHVEQQEEKPSVSPIISPKDGTVISGSVRPNSLLKGTALSPVDAARLQNQRLLSAYKSRLTASSTNKAQVATMNLTVQRRLAENVAVAKAREESLLKKQKERNRRLQEQAARSLHSTMGMSQDELERRQFYFNVLQFENKSKQLLSWRERLKANPKDPEQVMTLVTYILSIEEHPFTQMLHKYQYTTYNRVLPLIEKYSVQFEHSMSKERKNSSSLKTANCNEDKPIARSAETDSLLNHSQISSHPGSPDTAYLSNLPSLGESSPANGRASVTSGDNVSLQSKDEGISDVSEDKGIPCSPHPNTDCSTPTQLSPNLASYDIISPRETQLSNIVTIETMEKEALQRHLDNIVGDVHEFLSKLKSFLVVIYEDLDTVEGRDASYASLEAPFYKPLWGYIIALYRIVHKVKEDDLRYVLKTHSHFMPRDISVGEKYCLDDGLPSPYLYPYQPAVTELRKVTQYTSPLTKLQCIVKSSRTICSCVEEHFGRWEKHESVNIGADDLLPILSYVLLKSDLPILLAESHALVEFIDEGYLMGEEGYCLTSLQTALGYVLTLAEESSLDISSTPES